MALVALALSGCGDVKTDVETARAPVHPGPLAVARPDASATNRAVSAVRADVGNYGNTEKWFAVAELNDEGKRLEGARREASRRQRMASAPTSAAPSAAFAPSIASVMAPSDCEGLLHHYFGDVYSWALHIVTRESRCTPGAVNYREGCDTSGRTQSHAEGYWQICWPQHSALAARAGCSNPLDGDCNMRMARALYDEEGRGPWGG